MKFWRLFTRNKQDNSNDNSNQNQDGDNQDNKSNDVSSNNDNTSNNSNDVNNEEQNNQNEDSSDTNNNQNNDSQDGNDNSNQNNDDDLNSDNNSSNDNNQANQDNSDDLDMEDNQNSNSLDNSLDSNSSDNSEENENDNQNSSSMQVTLNIPIPMSGSYDDGDAESKEGRDSQSSPEMQSSDNSSGNNNDMNNKEDTNSQSNQNSNSQNNGDNNFQNQSSFMQDSNNNTNQPSNSDNSIDDTTREQNNVGADDTDNLEKNTENGSSNEEKDGDLQDNANEKEQNKEQNSNNGKKEDKDIDKDIEGDENSKSPSNSCKLEKNVNAEFLNELKQIPSFEGRERGAGYAFNLQSSEEVTERIIKVLLTKFLNQRFCKNDTDLNTRANSLERKDGFYKWNVKDVVIHLETEQYVKVLNDKYGYTYAEGKNESVPLSFYFDMSGSMSNYSGTLAVIATELLKKNVKVLIGFNEFVHVQVESVSNKVDEKRLTDFLSKALDDDKEELRDKYPEINFKLINEDIDDYLIGAKAEKCVIFADFDARNEFINLSKYCKTYWFTFESYYGSKDLTGFEGFSYKVNNIGDIADGLLKINENRFESLVYINDVKKKVRK